MRVFMLGWEFPPFISGGLGTACYGLTKGLSELGADVIFVLPRPPSPPSDDASANGSPNGHSHSLPQPPPPHEAPTAEELRDFRSAFDASNAPARPSAPPAPVPVQAAFRHAAPSPSTAAQSPPASPAPWSGPSQTGPGPSPSGPASMPPLPAAFQRVSFHPIAVHLVDPYQRPADYVRPPVAIDESTASQAAPAHYDPAAPPSAAPVESESPQLTSVPSTFAPFEAPQSSPVSEPPQPVAATPPPIAAASTEPPSLEPIEAPQPAESSSRVNSLTSSLMKTEPPSPQRQPSGAPLPKEPAAESAPATEAKLSPPRTKYDPSSHDLFFEVERYAELAANLARQETYDVVHAHDWMTFPAGMAAAAARGAPLVVHVHSTEFDRAGTNIDKRIYDIERRGMHAAMKVIAVSYLTRSVIIERYGVDPAKIEVVYNAIDLETEKGFDADRYSIHPEEKIVLFLGRITQQKGPEYFLAAAKKVLEVMDDVKFVMAGSGDLTRQTVQMAAQMNIGHKVLFTGFLQRDDVERVFALADLYVMPSVSEPFGIAPLEAMSHDVPVLISKQSGASEVLKHVLKADFWDIDDMANKIVAVLKHPPLAQSLREHGSFEVRQFSWSDAADACLRVYEAAQQMVIGM